MNLRLVHTDRAGTDGASEPRDDAAAPRRILVEQRMLRRVSVRSVVIVAGAFNLATAVVAFFAGIIVWNLIAGSEVVRGLEELLADLSTSGRFSFGGPRLALAWFVITFGWAIVATALALLAAVAFNSIAALSGGIGLGLARRTTVTAPAAPRPRTRERSALDVDDLDADGGARRGGVADRGANARADQRLAQG